MNLRSMREAARLLRRENALRGVDPATRWRTLASSVATPRRLAGERRLHLGCGEHLIPGWANIDLIGFPGVVPWNLAQPLPVADGTVDRVFSEHFHEHITLAQGIALLAEIHRVLKTGGVVRISTPDMEKLITEYQARRVDEWLDVEWAPETPCQMLNEGVRLWGHEFIYDFDELALQLRRVGFRDVRRVSWRESEHDDLRGLEARPFHGELIVEAVK